VLHLVRLSGLDLVVEKLRFQVNLGPVLLVSRVNHDDLIDFGKLLR
jgi:hypothetical protein